MPYTAWSLRLTHCILLDKYSYVNMASTRVRFVRTILVRGFYSSHTIRFISHRGFSTLLQHVTLGRSDVLGFVVACSTPHSHLILMLMDCAL
jgi:hypothetical protein